jgi:hypothetical protein
MSDSHRDDNFDKEKEKLRSQINSTLDIILNEWSQDTGNVNEILKLDSLNTELNSATTKEELISISTKFNNVITQRNPSNIDDKKVNTNIITTPMKKYDFSKSSRTAKNNKDLLLRESKKCLD